MTTRSLPLRILYTINAAPQYILAKSLSAYPVELISLDDGHPHIYGSTALKHCLHTICRSSPELVQDNSRDFSVYVLDPLESNSAPAPVQISDSSKNGDAPPDNAPGVAVGLGLMSWALRDEEPITAVGTLVRQGKSESLEIVFALRETVSQNYALWNAPTTISHQLSQLVNLMSHPNPPNSVASTSSTTTSFISTSVNHSQPQSNCAAYIPSTSTQKSQRSSRVDAKAKPKTKKPVPTTGSDKLLDSADVYIGPQKKKGRPRVTRVDPVHDAPLSSKGKEKEVIVLDHDSHRQQTAPSTSAASTPYAATSTSTSYQPSSAPTPTPPPVKSEDPDDAQALQIAKLLSGNSPENAAILATLNSIDSINESDVNSNPVLIAALKQLMAAMQKQGQQQAQAQSPAPVPAPAPTSTPAPAPVSAPAPGPTPPVAQDDDIVLLDKENVNPVVFNKKRRDVDAKLQTLNGTVASQSAPPSRSASFTLRTRSNENTPPQNQPLSRAQSDAGASNAPRKRTLSDFMEERDNNRSREKSTRPREQERPRPTFLQPKPPTMDAYRHYRFLDSGLPNSDNPSSHYRTTLEPWTSPVRSKQDKPDPYLADSEAKGSGNVSSRSPNRTSKTAASSPIRKGEGVTRKKYVVPAWARTNTATQPRLSEEAQQALKEAEERKRLERKEARRKSSNAQERARRKRELGEDSSTAGPSASTSTSTSSGTATAGPSRLAPMKPPVLPRSSPVRPLVAAANISPFASLFASPRRRSPSPDNRFVLPQTPTRPRKTGSLASGGMGDSLFTPGSLSGSIFGSAKTSLFTPDAGYGPSGSPLNRKKMRTTPKTPLGGSPRKRLFDVPFTTSSDPKDLEEVEKVIDAELEKELDAAFEDLNTPPSSLPVASSDTELEGEDAEDTSMKGTTMDLPPSSQETASTADEDEDNVRRPHKEIWEGLPPSSPPPPSSPGLLPEHPSDTDMDDLELPVATSDMDTDSTDAEGMLSDGGLLPVSEEEGACNADSLAEFTAYLATFTSGNEHGMPIMQSDDMFDQFTNLNAHSDGSVFQQGSDQTVTNFNPLDDVDFSGLWTNLTPIIQTNMVHNPAGNAANSDLPLDFGLGGMGGATGSVPAFDFGNLEGVELNAEGMVKDMKDLLGGCLV